MIIFGAGVVGEATMRACRKKNLPIQFIVDHRVKGDLDGVPIVRLDDVGERGEVLQFLLTSPNIQDMIRPLEAKGFQNWASCGTVLKDFDISSVDWGHTGYSTEHVKYLVRTALHHHDNYLKPELLTVQSDDIVITEKCTMKCKDCSNLMQYYENPENQELNEVLGSIDDLCSRMDEIYEMRVIGGEPFVNKEIHLIVDKLTSQEKIKKVSIFTNATVVPKDTQWAALSHPKVRFFITDYKEKSRNIKPLIEALEERKISYVSEEANDWTECASLEQQFRTPEGNAKLFDACCAKNLATVMDGRLYRCPFSAHATKLRALPNYTDDYLVLSQTNSKEIGAFLRGRPFINACDHCNGRSYGDVLIEPAIQTKVPLKYRKFDLKDVRGALPQPN